MLDRVPIVFPKTQQFTFIPNQRTLVAEDPTMFYGLDCNGTCSGDIASRELRGLAATDMPGSDLLVAPESQVSAAQAQAFAKLMTALAEPLKLFTARMERIAPSITGAAIAALSPSWQARVKVQQQFVGAAMRELANRAEKVVAQNNPETWNTFVQGAVTLVPPMINELVSDLERSTQQSTMPAVSPSSYAAVARALDMQVPTLPAASQTLPAQQGTTVATTALLVGLGVLATWFVVKHT